MPFQGKAIAMGLTAAFDDTSNALVLMDAFCTAGACVVPFFSYTLNETDSPYSSAQSLRTGARRICGVSPITHMFDAARKAREFDLFVLAPCTLRSLEALCRGTCDTPPLIGARIHLGLDKPLLICVHTGTDGLCALPSIGNLLLRKNIFFAPFCQDGEAPQYPCLRARRDLILPAAALALENKQLQPVLCQRRDPLA